MMPSLTGLFTLAIMAFGAIVGSLLIIPLAIAGIWIDGAMVWAWVPPVAGVIGGGVVGWILESRP